MEIETSASSPPSAPPAGQPGVRSSTGQDLSGLSIPRSERAGGAVKRWLIRIAVVLGVGALIFAFKDRLPGAGGGALEVETLVLEPLAAVELLVLDGTSANGYVVAARRAALSADRAGRIVELNVTEGSEIEHGEVVARLYFDEAQANLDRAAAEVAAAERDVERTRALAEAARADVPRLERAVEAAAAAVEARRSNINAAEARLELARLQLERVQPLVTSNIRPESDLDQARSTLDAAQADLETARADLTAAEARVSEARGAVSSSEGQVLAAEAAIPLAEAQTAIRRAGLAASEALFENTFVRAPFDGIVVLKDAEIGEVVSPNSQGGSNARGSVATMVDRASLEVQAEVPETSLAAVRIGGLARIVLDAFPDAPYAGRVDRIWPTANRQKATVEVRVAFEAPDEWLRPEMGVRVIFLDPELEAQDLAAAEASGELLLVPERALVERGGTRGAFVLQGGQVEFRSLTLGELRAGRFVVERGLDAGETVVLEPAPELADGAAVRASDG